jgi:hypothetical protein
MLSALSSQCSTWTYRTLDGDSACVQSPPRVFLDAHRLSTLSKSGFSSFSFSSTACTLPARSAVLTAGGKLPPKLAMMPPAARMVNRQHLANAMTSVTPLGTDPKRSSLRTPVFEGLLGGYGVSSGAGKKSPLRLVGGRR